MKNLDYKYSEVIAEIIKNKNISESSKENCNKQIRHRGDIFEDCYTINTDKEVKLYHKEKGVYKLLSIPNVLYASDKDLDYIKKLATSMLKSIIGDIKAKDRVLIVGLGNRHISSDSLGSKVISKININIMCKNKPRVMAFCPSVLGLTGIETYDILDGVIEKTKPTHLILIDSLCAGDIDRLGRSLQISDTGLCPGSGIGNRRKCLDKTLIKNIYSIGVPLLIYASTFIRNSFDDKNINLDTLNNAMQKCKNYLNMQEFCGFLDGVKRVYMDNLDNVIVSIKDIEECVDVLSDIIAIAINNVLYSK